MAKGTGKRLSDEAREQIKSAPQGTTLAELAKKFNTSINTVQRYRGKRASQPKAAAERKSPTIVDAGRNNMAMIRDVIAMRLPADTRLKLISYLAV